MIQEIIERCKRIKDGRTIVRPILKVAEEAGELAVEVNIKLGNLPTSKAGGDGITGEAVDLLLSTVDVIVQNNPNITEEDLLGLVRKKLDKWESSPIKLTFPRTVHVRDTDNEVWKTKLLVAIREPIKVNEYPYIVTGMFEGNTCVSSFDGYKQMKEL